MAATKTASAAAPGPGCQPTGEPVDRTVAAIAFSWLLALGAVPELEVPRACARGQ